MIVQGVLWQYMGVSPSGWHTLWEVPHRVVVRTPTGFYGEHRIVGYLRLAPDGRPGVITATTATREDEEKDGFTLV